MGQQEYHYYLQASLSELTVPAKVHIILPDTKIPPHLRFRVDEDGLFIEPGLSVLKIESGETLQSAGQRISFPDDDSTYRIVITGNLSVYLWTTRLNPQEWVKAQPLHTFA